MATMKTESTIKTFAMLLLMVLMISCKESQKETVNEESTSQTEREVQVGPEVTPSEKGTYLCKINDKDWAYTEASGIVSRDKKTNKRTAIITFKKKLEKGSESIQLTYDGDSFQLERILLILKFPKKGGGLLTSYYSLGPKTRSKHPESEMSGTLNLSNPTKASGNANLVEISIDHEKNKLDNDEDAVLTFSDLKFSGIGYSDLEKLFKN